MKYYLFLLALFACFSNIYTQTCAPNGILLRDQMDVDSFNVTYPGCTQVLGNLRVAGPNDVTDLTPLSQVVYVGKDLYLQSCPNITDLHGLHNITYVGEDLRIINCNRLKNLSGLTSIDSIGANLEIKSHDSILNLSGLGPIETIGDKLLIHYNDQLQNFQGLDSLTYVDGDVRFANNDVLSDFSGLEKLDSVNGTFEIVRNEKLITLSGLNNLTSINDDLTIFENDELDNVIGLNSLNTINGDLVIENNPLLTDLSSLLNLTTLKGVLEIRNNDDLQSLYGLDNIDTSYLTYLRIISCIQLNYCHVQSICSYLGDFMNGAGVQSNATGCNTEAEIRTLCQILPVELVEFKAEYKNEQTFLNWTTLSESSNRGFVIERRNPITLFWDRIGFVKGNGTSEQETNYSFGDNTPHSGINYYRLRQIDFNNDFSFSKIISIEAEHKNEMTFYPNPTNGLIYTVNKDLKECTIFNVFGKVVLETQVRNNQLDLSNLPKGTYFLKDTSKGTVQQSIEIILKQ